jgi:hypothetical protein
MNDPQPFLIKSDLYPLLAVDGPLGCTCLINALAGQVEY